MTAGPKRSKRPALVFGSLAVWAVGAKASRATRAVWAGKGDLTAKLDRLNAALIAEAQRLSVPLNTTDALAGLALVVLVLLMIAYSKAGRQTERIGEEHGSAAWGTARDMRPFAARGKEPRLTFTATEALSCDTRRTERNLNALVVGVAGTRKSRSYVMPNMLDRRSLFSFAATDPKGELYRETHEQLEQQGMDVRCLNLVDLSESWGFNPFEYVSPSQPSVSLIQLAATIVQNTTGSQPASSSKDPFWEKGEQLLLTALCALVYFGGDFLDAGTDDEGTRIEYTPSLVNVVDLVRRIETTQTETADDESESTVDSLFEQVGEILDTWTDLPDVTKQISDQTRDGLEFALSQFQLFKTGAGNTRASFIVSLGVRLGVLNVPEARRIMEYDTLDIDSLAEKRAVIFCILPDTNDAFTFISALFWSTFFQRHIYIADHSPSGHTAVPIHAFLDEFANIGVIPSFDKIISTIRSRGISASIIIQNIPQLKSRYKDDWETIAGNCDSTLCLGSVDQTTKEWISKRLGPSTIRVEDRSQSYGRNGSWSRSTKMMKRDLMTPDEVEHMSNDYCLYLLRGVKPFYSRKAKLYVGR